MHVRGLALGIFSLLALGCGDNDPGISFSEDIAPIFEGRCNICHHPNSAIGYEFTVAFDRERGIVNRINSWTENPDHNTLYDLVVDPGNPGNSSLFGKVGNPDLPKPDEGDKMPLRPGEVRYDEKLRILLGDQPDLTLTEEEREATLEAFREADLAAVEAWITAGANDDQTFEAVAEFFGTEISLRPSLAGVCTYCHYPDSPTGMSVLDVFDPDEGMVGVEANSGGILVIPGDPANSVLMRRLRGEGGARMPLHFTPLSPEEVQKIVDWIVVGAPNN